jgi:putative sterol carrier protein
MPAFLTDDWIAALAEAGAAIVVPDDVSLSLCQVVDDVRWTVRLGGGRVAVDRDPSADLTLTTDGATAAAIARGELAAQDAVAAGRLRFEGDVTKLLASAPALAVTETAYATLRSPTTY